MQNVMLIPVDPLLQRHCKDNEIPPLYIAKHIQTILYIFSSKRA